MKEGEARKIYIHPVYGYGVTTTLPPCTFLIANVTLHKVNGHSKGVLPSLDPLELSWVNDPEVFREIEHSTLTLARSLGSRWGVWLGNSPDLNFVKLCEELNFLSQMDCPPLSNEEQQMCNRVFWNIMAQETPIF